MRVRPFSGLVLLACAGAVALSAEPESGEPVLPARVLVAEMKTSIYVGRVTLETSAFERAGDRWTATYDARVFPWAFWSEHGSITITVPEADLARLQRGETVEFSGSAENHRRKPREVTGRAQPDAADAGRIKVRIRVDGVELIFNGHYSLAAPP